jgi:hypothetical protein
MEDSIWDAIGTALGDATLTTLLGGSGHVFGGPHNPQNVKYPCVNYYELSDPSTPLPGFTRSGRRKNEPMVQVDVWVRTNTGDLNAITSRIDAVLLAGIANTGRWVKTTSSAPYEPGSKTYHAALRYRFAYILDDT